MALDRRIAVAITAPGTRDIYGFWVPGRRIDYHVWAELRPQSLERRLETYGLLTQVAVAWRVRHRQDFLDAAQDDLERVHIIDSGETYNATKVIEDTGAFFSQRRRYIIIEGVRA